MKKQLKQLAIAFFVVIGVLSVVCAVPKGNALTVNYGDDYWNHVIVTGPDTVEPGNVESYTVEAKLRLQANTAVKVTFIVDTASEQSKIILEETPVPFLNYPGGGAGYVAGATFSKTYKVTIPNDAINNTFVRCNIGTELASVSTAVSWVQDPTYSSLQDQISSLNSTLAILQSTYGGSASEIMSLQSLVLTLQSEKENLQNQLNATQCSLDDANTKLNSSNYSMYGALLTAVVFIIVSVVLAVLLTRKRTTVKEKGTQ
jgi:hypothetical protein